MEYEVHISPKMREACQWLEDNCIGMNFCIYDLGRNLVVETAKSDCDLAVKTLKEKFQDVVLITKAYAMLEDLHDYILVKQMISESPLCEIDEVPVPQLEKQLVDMVADKTYEHMNRDDIDLEFQRAFERYDVNTSKMVRYASRKGKKEEVQKRLDGLNKGRIETVKAIQHYLAKTPFDKVWMFGSFSRMEDGAASDIDLLAQLGKSNKLGLVELSGIVMGLEEVAHRPIDLVMEGAVKPFARQSIEKDKVLIYERTR